MEAASLWAGVRFTARNGSPEALFDRCRRTRAAFIRYFFPARRLLRPLRSMAVPTAGRTCPAQAGAAAGRKNGMGFIFCCVRCCGARGFG